MEIIGWLLLGVLATYVLTWSITVDDSEGPFYAYNFVRWFVRRPFMPKLVRDNAHCPYCCSFWCAALVALLLPIYEGMNPGRMVVSLFVVTYGLHGAVVIYFRYLKLFFAIGANES